MNEKATHGYFFDLDGTLVDTHTSNLKAYSHAIRDVLPDMPFDEDELYRRISSGESSSRFLPALLPDITHAQKASVNARKAELYPSYVPLSILNEELAAKAHQWREQPGSLLVLVTTAKRTNAQAVLAYHSIEGMFDLKIYGDDVTHLKPDPEIYLKALRESGLKPDKVDAFEDSNVGIEAAVAAGIRAHRVTWTGSSQ